MERKIYESAKLKFIGVDGFDVYNCSAPFTHQGKTYLFGRVEKRDEWANSYAFLFEKTGEDEYTLVKESRQYQLEDPYVIVIGDELVLGGTHVTKVKGEIESYCGYFYRGKDLLNLTYFTTGPKGMKDIRLVPMADGKIGVFSRPRDVKLIEQYGSESMIGFTTVSSLDELDGEVIDNAKLIHGIFEHGQWGGCNQAYPLKNGKIGVIGHISDRLTGKDGEEILSYRNISFVFDPETYQVDDIRLLATKADYPAGPAKVPNLVDCAFTSGIEKREDGKVNLYSGIGDCEEGRVVIDDPFGGQEEYPLCF